MRTTLQIDDDVLLAARSLAQSEDKTVGRVISDLARKGLTPSRQKQTHSGFPVFSVSDESPPITPEMVRRALEDDG